MFSGELSALAVTGSVLLAATIAIRLGKRQRDETDDDNEDEQHNNYAELVKNVGEATKLSSHWDASSHRLILSFTKDQVPLTKKEVLDALNSVGLKALALDDTTSTIAEGDKTTTSSVVSIAPPNTTQTKSEYLKKLAGCFSVKEKTGKAAGEETENGDTATSSSSAKPASKRARGGKNN